MGNWTSKIHCTALEVRTVLASLKKSYIDSALPVADEESCLVQCADLIFTLYISLQLYHVKLDATYSYLKNLKEMLIVSTVEKQYEFNRLLRGMTRFKVHLSWQ